MLQCYAILDTAVQAFQHIFCFENDAVAKRAFLVLANDETSQVNRWPESYSLWRVGSFDQNSGMIEPVWPNERICSALELLDAQQSRQPDMFTPSDADEVRSALNGENGNA